MERLLVRVISHYCHRGPASAGAGRITLEIGTVVRSLPGQCRQ
jgi:hypothetical protein